MSENKVFLKKITELPDAGAIAGGDKVPVVRNGQAMQVDASNMGGGGMQIIYIQPANPENPLEAFIAYKDPEYQEVMTYVEGINAAKKGAMCFTDLMGAPTYVPALTVVLDDANKKMTVVTFLHFYAEMMDGSIVLFSDTVLD